MRKMPKERGILRLNLDAVERSLAGVQRDWHIIESELSNRSIGKKDAPFNSLLKERMIAAYNHLDTLLRDGVRPFSEESIMEMCRLNEYVHYGDDKSLRREQSQAIAANEEKYYRILGAEHERRMAIVKVYPTRYYACCPVVSLYK